jgi:hypothetical protein
MANRTPASTDSRLADGLSYQLLSSSVPPVGIEPTPKQIKSLLCDHYTWAT